MSQYGQVQVVDGRYKFRGDFHCLEQHMPIRDADHGYRLLGVTKPRDMTYVHTYGGEAPFFEALSQGKLLATKCENPDCEANAPSSSRSASTAPIVWARTPSST
jgi:hypothetical protein